MVVGVALMYMLVVKTIESIHECDMRYIATDSQLCTRLVHSHLGLCNNLVEVRCVVRCVDLLQRIAGSLPTTVCVVGNLTVDTVFVTRLLIGIVCDVTLHERLFDVVRSPNVLTNVSIGE